MIHPPENLSPGTRRLAILSHCSGLLGCFIPGLGHLLPPLVFWLLARSSDAYVEEHARESLNFQVCSALLFLSASLIVLGFSSAGLWISLFFILYYLGTVLGCLIAAAQVRDDKPFRYPLPFRILR